MSLFLRALGDLEEGSDTELPAFALSQWDNSEDNVTGKATFPALQGFGCVMPRDGRCRQNAFRKIGTKALALVCLTAGFHTSPFLECLCAGSIARRSSLLPALPLLSLTLPSEEWSEAAGWSQLCSRLPNPK